MPSDSNMSPPNDSNPNSFAQGLSHRGLYEALTAYRGSNAMADVLSPALVQGTSR